MEQLELGVEPRVGHGSARARRLRKGGQVPAVVYSGGSEAQKLVLNEHDFVMCVRGRPRAQMYAFKSSDASLNGMKAMVKDVHIEPLKESILHVDFLAVKEGQTVLIQVPVRVTGQPPSVREGRGILNQIAYEIELECLAELVPTEMVIDVSSLAEGDSVRASALALPDGSTLKSSPDLVVVTIFGATKVETVAETPAVAAEADKTDGATDGTTDGTTEGEKEDGGS